MGRWGRLLLSEAQLEEVLGAQDQEEQEVRECQEAQGCQEVPECQEEDTATQDVSASICPVTWEVLECPQCHQLGLDQELDLGLDLVPHLFLPRVETEQEAPQVTASAGWLRGAPGSSEELRQRSTSGHGRLGWSGAAALLSSAARL